MPPPTDLSHDAADPSATAAEAQTPRALLHDLANILDASIRCAAASRAGNDTAPLHALEAALAQMADLVTELGPRRRLMPPGAGLAIDHTIFHVLELMRPVAAEHSVALRSHVDPRVGAYRIRGLYRVIADALRNSLDAIALACCALDCPGGEVLVRAAIETDHETGEDARLFIQVIDDGVGPAPHDPPQTTSAGLGLAIARCIVARARGTVELRAGSGQRFGRPGAVLHLSFPLDVLLHDPATR